MTSVFVQLTALHCAGCGMLFELPEDWRLRRVADHKNFYCPAGHINVYTGESEAEKLRRQLNNSEERERMARADLQGEQRRRVRAENKLKRVKCGVCPECNRSFPNLQRHMASKHEVKGA